MPTVKAETTVTPAMLRAYLARHDVSQAQIAERLGVTRQAISAALRADLTGRPFTQDLMRRILDAANEILLARERVVHDG